MLRHPAIAEAAVVASPDPVRHAVPKAFVLLAAGLSPPSADLARNIFRIRAAERVRRTSASAAWNSRICRRPFRARSGGCSCARAVRSRARGSSGRRSSRINAQQRSGLETLCRRRRLPHHLFNWWQLAELALREPAPLGYDAPAEARRGIDRLRRPRDTPGAPRRRGRVPPAPVPDNRGPPDRRGGAR